MSSLGQDLRFAFRTFGKNKGFVAVAVLTLAVGIGLNAAVFTIINAWLFKGLPFDNNSRIVFLGSKDLTHDFDSGRSPIPTCATGARDPNPSPASLPLPCERRCRCGRQGIENAVQRKKLR